MKNMNGEAMLSPETAKAIIETVKPCIEDGSFLFVGIRPDNNGKPLLTTFNCLTSNDIIPIGASLKQAREQHPEYVDELVANLKMISSGLDPLFFELERKSKEVRDEK